MKYLYEVTFCAPGGTDKLMLYYAADNFMTVATEAVSKAQRDGNTEVLAVIQTDSKHSSEEIIDLRESNELIEKESWYTIEYRRVNTTQWKTLHYDGSFATFAGADRRARP